MATNTKEDSVYYKKSSHLFEVLSGTDNLSYNTALYLWETLKIGTIVHRKTSNGHRKASNEHRKTSNKHWKASFEYHKSSIKSQINSIERYNSSVEYQNSMNLI